LIYQAGTVIEAEMQRDEFARKWDATYPMVSQIWRRNWERIIPFFAYHRRDPEGDLHDQHDRVAEHVAAQNHQDARVVPERRRRHETAVFGFAECLEKMDHAGAELERGLEPLQHSLAGPDARPGSRLIDAGGKTRKGALLSWGRCPQTPGI